MTENHLGQNYLSIEAVQQEYNRDRLLQWFDERNLYQYSEFRDQPDQLIQKIISFSPLLFAVLVLARLERLFPLLKSFGLQDDCLSDVISFERICESAALTESDIDILRNARTRAGVVLCKNRHQIFSTGTVVPYKSVNHPKDDRFGGFGVVRRVDIASGHLQGYSEVCAC